MKLCKDCAHFKQVEWGIRMLPPPPNFVFFRCNAPQAQGDPDPVFGHVSAVNARTEREGAAGYCGAQARWFEPIPEPINTVAIAPKWWRRLVRQ